MDNNGKKRPGSPGNPAPPSPKRSNSVRDSVSDILQGEAAGLVTEHYPQLPRTSTLDDRAPRAPLSPYTEGDSSESEDLFWEGDPAASVSDDGTPLPPNNSDADLVGNLSFQLGSVLRPAVLQPPPALQLPVMAQAEPVPPAENASRMEITNSLEEAEIFIQGDVHAGAQAAAGGLVGLARQKTRFRKASRDLSEAEAELDKLKKIATLRIAKIANENVREASRQEWVGYKIHIVNRIEDLRDDLIENDPKRQNEEEQLNASVVASKDIITAHITQINDLLKQIGEDLTGLTANEVELNKSQYTALKVRMLDAKKLISPGIDDLYKQQLSLDGSRSEVVHNDHTKDVKDINKIYSDLWNLLHANLNDTVLAFNPPGHSTANNTVVGATNCSIGNKSGYSYRSDKYPKFKWTYRSYPAWKKEMIEDILIGKSSSHQMRIMGEFSGYPNLDNMFDDPVKAWAWLDNKWANETVIIDTVCAEWSAKKSVSGLNECAKLVNLYEEVLELQLTLRLYREEELLTAARPMISKFQSLLPEKFREEFHHQLCRHETELGDKLKGTARFQYLMKYVESKVNYIEHNLPHMLVQNSDPAAPDAPLHPASASSVTDGSLGATPKVSRRERKQANVNAMQAAGSTGTAGASRARGSSVTGGPPDGALSEKTKKYCEEKWALYKPCPVCGAKGHYYEGPRGWGPSQSLQDCPKFRNEMNVNQRADIVIDKKLCIRCLNTQHTTRDCKKDRENWYCREMVGSAQCKQQHSNYLHGATRKLVNNIQCQAILDLAVWKFEEMSQDDLDAHLALRTDAMLPVVRVELAEGIPATLLLDGGSNCTVIRDGFARSLGMKPTVVNTNITVCGNQTKNVDLNYYCITVMLSEVPRKIFMLGMDTITSVPGDYDISIAYELFPHIERGLLDKPGGEVDIIIGQDNGDLLPSGGQGVNEVGLLRVSDISFGPGKVLTGSHPQIKFENPSLSTEAQMACYHTTFTRPSKNLLTCHLHSEPVMDFYECEMMPFSAPRRCSSCMGCEVCTVTRQGMTVTEKREYQAMRENLTHDPDTNIVTVSWIMVDSSLRNNNTGPRLTELYMKVPNTINDLFSTLISWRSFVVGGFLDIKKAFLSMRSTIKEKFMSLVVRKFHVCDDTIRIPDLLKVTARNRSRRVSSEPGLESITEEQPEVSEVEPVTEEQPEVSQEEYINLFCSSPDTQVYINTLAANITTVQSPDYTCSESSLRHHLVYNRDWKDTAEDSLSHQT